MGAGTDQSFLDKLNKNFMSHAHFQSYLSQRDRSLSTTNFRLKHYAGDVYYYLFITIYFSIHELIIYYYFFLNFY